MSPTDGKYNTSECYECYLQGEGMDEEALRYLLASLMPRLVRRAWLNLET